MSQGSLFKMDEMQKESTWKPPSNLPEIRGKFKSIGFDVESTGKRKFKDKKVGMGIYTPDGNKYYIPTGHAEGGNLDKAFVQRWAERELRDVQLVGLNIGFDTEMCLNDGLDLEAQNCTLRDVAHSAALLNENRYSGFNLDSLGKEYVGRGKTESKVPPDQIGRAHSSLVGLYGEDDAELGYKVFEQQGPQLDAEGLQQVQSLEDDIIWANNHMERSGCRLDVELLHKWVLETRDLHASLVLDIWRATKIRINPNSSDDLKKLFIHLGIEDRHHDPVSGNESFTKQFMMKQQDPVIKMAFKAKQIAGLKSKYLDKYERKVDGDILRFSLYQLRANEEDYGTVSGRYSCANDNLQQVFSPERQIEEYGSDDYLIRQLMLPDDGFDMFAGDASQIEFRLFAHYSVPSGQSENRLTRAYWENPDQDFHDMVATMLKQSRKKAKGNNFGKLYGMGRKKMARQLGLACVCGCPDKFAWDNTRHAGGCPMIEANDLVDEYDRKFPEAKKLMNTAMDLAEKRGFVKTLLGRRQRFPTKERLHSALNRVIQGSAADLFKMKVRRLYNERKTIGIYKLRYPVHDEQVGDVERDAAARRRLEDCFAQFEYDLKVPILWKIKYGNNWKECA